MHGCETLLRVAERAHERSRPCRIWQSVTAASKAGEAVSVAISKRSFLDLALGDVSGFGRYGSKSKKALAAVVVHEREKKEDRVSDDNAAANDSGGLSKLFSCLESDSQRKRRTYVWW